MIETFQISFPANEVHKGPHTRSNEVQRSATKFKMFQISETFSSVQLLLLYLKIRINAHDPH